VAEAGPVLATVDPADIRGLVTTRLWNVAELLRSRLEYSAEGTTHNVNEDSPCRGRASATAMTVFVCAGSARSQPLVTLTATAMAHMKATNSRAIAVTTTCLVLPLSVSRR
jgi:hypothetical protein